MRISKVSQMLGISVSTISFYEKKAIIPKPAMSGGARSYTDNDTKIIGFVRDTQSVGFSLREIAQLVNNDPTVSTTTPQCQVMPSNWRPWLASIEKRCMLKFSS